MLQAHLATCASAALEPVLLWLMGRILTLSSFAAPPPVAPAVVLAAPSATVGLTSAAFRKSESMGGTAKPVALRAPSTTPVWQQTPGGLILTNLPLRMVELLPPSSQRRPRPTSLPTLTRPGLSSPRNGTSHMDVHLPGPSAVIV